MPSGVFKRTREHIRNLANSIRGRKRSKRAIANIRRGVNRPSVKRSHSRSLRRCWQNPKYIRNWKKSRHTPKGQRSGVGPRSKATKRRMSLAAKKSHNTKEARRNYSLARKRVLRNLSPKARKEFGEHLKRIRPFGKGPSKIQLSIFRFLCRKGICGQRLEHVVGTRAIDVAFPSKKLAIEIDGKHWHRNKSRERRRNNFLRNLGWSVYHFNASSKSKLRVLRLLERKQEAA